MIAVAPGQVWADNDKRQAGRMVRVFLVYRGDAYCTVTAIPENGRAARLMRQPQSILGFVTRIRASRFKPTSTGYRLVEEVH